jgi:hypothetical protein
MLQTEAYLTILLMIVNYNGKTFIIQATGFNVIKLITAVTP